MMRRFEMNEYCSVLSERGAAGGPLGRRRSLHRDHGTHCIPVPATFKRNLVYFENNPKINQQ